MKNRIFKEWISSVLGLLIVIFAGVLFFVDTNFELSLLQIGFIASVGILLIFSKDTLINIISKKAE